MAAHPSVAWRHPATAAPRASSRISRPSPHRVVSLPAPSRVLCRQAAALSGSGVSCNFSAPASPLAPCFRAVACSSSANLLRDPSARFSVESSRPRGVIGPSRRVVRSPPSLAPFHDQTGASRRRLAAPRAAKYLGKFGSAPAAESAASTGAGATAAAAAAGAAKSPLSGLPPLVRQLLPLTAAVVLPVAATAAAFAAAGFGKRDAGEWFRSLNPPAFAPPDWLLAATWTVLQLPAGVASWVVWREGGWARQRGPLELYLVQLALGLLWPVVMFRLRNVDAGAAVAGALIVAGISTAIAFHRATPLASFLFFPLLLWLALVAAITYTIWTNHSTLIDQRQWQEAVGRGWEGVRRWGGGGGGGGGGFGWWGVGNRSGRGGGGGGGGGVGGWDDGEWSAAPSNQNNRRD